VPPSDSRLNGEVAIVTGAGRGIGRAVALALADAGADLAMAARSAGELEEVAAQAREAHGVRALAVPTDVTDAAAVETLVERALNELGGLAILVNCSGIVHEGSFLNTSQADFDHVLDVNLRGVALCCRAAGRALVEQGRGKIVNVASMYAERAIAGAAAYCASKAAVVNLTRALALEWARHGVQVNAVAPGYVATAMNEDVRAVPEHRDAILRRIPARRFGEPAEVAALVSYLVGPLSGFITGECITIDGGQLARA
jgi:NAD(P)-dependent dehydrogenase (short-subunit alcohol dehydrogenase family)